MEPCAVDLWGLKVCRIRVGIKQKTLTHIRALSLRSGRKAAHTSQRLIGSQRRALPGLGSLDVTRLILPKDWLPDLRGSAAAFRTSEGLWHKLSVRSFRKIMKVFIMTTLQKNTANVVSTFWGGSLGLMSGCRLQ